MGCTRQYFRLPSDDSEADWEALDLLLVVVPLSSKNSVTRWNERKSMHVKVVRETGCWETKNVNQYVWFWPGLAEGRAFVPALALFSLVGNAHHGQCRLNFHSWASCLVLIENSLNKQWLALQGFLELGELEGKWTFIEYNKFTEETVEDG